METIRTLAHSQGFYGRLLAQIESLDKDSLAEFTSVMDSQNFKDSVDVVLFFET